MDKCPICRSGRINKVCSRYNISPYQNTLFLTSEDARIAEKVNLNIQICEECGFIFNSVFNPSLCLYDENYNNDQNMSQVFNRYVAESIDYLITNYIKDANTILEVGCGKYGTYLKELMPYLASTCRAIGFDPAYTEKENLFEGRLQIFSKLYDFNDMVKEDIDFLICRHVIEHIYRPLELIDNIQKLANRNIDMRAFIETPDATWILENEVWFDFCYEHCSYFSITSLQQALGETGLHLDDVKNVFNSQYIWAVVGNQKKHDLHEKWKKDLDSILNKARRYSINEPLKLEKYQQVLMELNKTGKVAVWGAGAKGNMFLNVLDKDKEYVSKVIDINLMKTNKYIAGTGHKVIAPEEIKNENIKTILVMNNNYYNEVIHKLKSQGIDDLNLMSIDKISSM